jgi:hypothetical protein
MPFAIPSPMQRPGEPHKNAMGNKKGPPTVGWGPLEDTAGGGGEKRGERRFRPLRLNFRRSGRCLS